MPRVHKKVARADIYRYGLKKKDEKTKSGERIDRSQPRDEHDEIIIPKGSIYYSWTFRYGGTKRSLTYPRQSQLTQSDFLQQAYGILENIEDFYATELSEVRDFIEEIISQAEELRDETEEKLNNMPDQLQYAPTGELLQERIDALDSFISELEGIDAEDIDEEEGEEAVQERLDEVMDELQNVCLDCC